MVSSTLLYVVLLTLVAAVGLGLLFRPQKNKALKLLVAEATSSEDLRDARGKSTFTAGPIARVAKFFRSRGLTPPAEPVVVVALFGAPLVGIAFVLLGSVGQKLLGVLIILAGPAFLYVMYSRAVTARQKAYAATLPDFLLTLSSAMQSGLSMEQAVKELSEGQKSVAEEVFFEIGRGLSYGESLDESLQYFAKIYKSDDTETLRQATAIGKKTGSSLTHVIESVAYSAIERAKVRREIVALTAEGMMSAYVIIALPFVATAFLLLTNRSYLSVFWETTQGMMLAGVAVLLIIVGWVWMRNMIQGESTKL